MDPNINYYQLLGVPTNADTETIQKAYKRAARRAHPDVGGDANTFAALTRARDVLTDPPTRARYDAVRAVALRGGNAQARQPRFKQQWERRPETQPSRATIYGTTNGDPSGQELARIVEQLPLPDHCFVFHQTSGVDHVIVAGNRLVMLRLVHAPSGIWRWDRHAKRPTVNGSRSSTAEQACLGSVAATDELVADIGWSDNNLEWARVLVVAPQPGDSGTIDLAEFSHPELDATTIGGLDGWLRAWWKHGYDGAPAGNVAYSPVGALAALRARTAQPDTVMTPHTAAQDRPDVADGQRARPDLPTGLVAYLTAMLTTLAVAAGAAAWSVTATTVVAFTAAVALTSWQLWAPQLRPPPPDPQDTVASDLATVADVRIPERFVPHPADIAAVPVAAGLTIAATAVLAPSLVAAAVVALTWAAAAAHPAWMCTRIATAHTGRTLQVATDRSRYPLVVHALRTHASDPAQRSAVKALENAGAKQAAAAIKGPR